MKPLVLCLLAVWCWCVADASADRLKQRKLGEVCRELKVVKSMLKKSGKMLSTPSENIEECCWLPALKCFRKNFEDNFNLTGKPQKRLYRSLKNPLTEKGLDVCDSQNSTCQACDSHPKKNVGEFFDSLESLILKAINRMN